MTRYTIYGDIFVSSAVSVKIFIDDAAVDFVSKYAKMDKRKARKKLAQKIIELGSLDTFYLGVSGRSVVVSDREEEDDERDLYYSFGELVFRIKVKWRWPTQKKSLDVNEKVDVPF